MCGTSRWIGHLLRGSLSFGQTAPRCNFLSFILTIEYDTQITPASIVIHPTSIHGLFLRRVIITHWIDPRSPTHRNQHRHWHLRQQLPQILSFHPSTHMELLTMLPTSHPVVILGSALVAHTLNHHRIHHGQVKDLRYFLLPFLQQITSYLVFSRTWYHFRASSALLAPTFGSNLWVCSLWRFFHLVW